MIIGITGNLGSGKTTVAKMFDGLGANIVDVDEIGHRVLDREGYKDVVDRFGPEILKNDLSIDRAQLRKIVFNDISKLKQLETILHKLILNEVELEIRRLSGIVVIEGAVIIEIGILGLIDKLIVVKCSKQEERVMDEDMERIISVQQPQKDLLDKADFVIDNDGSLEDTKMQVEEIWEMIK